MAALIRARPSAALLRNLPSIRLLSTSSKKSDSATATSSVAHKEDTIDFSIEAVRKSKNWVSYGFDREDKEWDRQIMRATFFCGITLIFVFGGLFFAYVPDPKLQHWAQREAYLQLRDREAAGVDLVSPDYVHASLVELPTDEELGDTEIII